MDAIFSTKVGCLLVVFATLIKIAESVLNGRKRHLRFKALTESRERQTALRRRFVTSFLNYGVLGLLGLALIGRFHSLWQTPPEIEHLGAGLGNSDLGVTPGGLHIFGYAILAEIIAVILLTSLLIPIYLRRRKKETRSLVLGDVRALIPRNASELRLCALLSINAGISEELFFRLLLPLAILGLINSAPVALLAATLAFAAGHAYQGWVGALASFVVGALLSVLYVATGNLCAVMALHVIIDLRILVIMPAFTAWLNRGCPAERTT